MELEVLSCEVIKSDGVTMIACKLLVYDYHTEVSAVTEDYEAIAQAFQENPAHTDEALFDIIKNDVVDDLYDEFKDFECNQCGRENCKSRDCFTAEWL